MSPYTRIFFTISLMVCAGCSDNSSRQDAGESGPPTIKEAYGLPSDRIEEKWQKKLTDVEARSGTWFRKISIRIIRPKRTG